MRVSIVRDTEADAAAAWAAALQEARAAFYGGPLAAVAAAAARSVAAAPAPAAPGSGAEAVLADAAANVPPAAAAAAGAGHGDAIAAAPAQGVVVLPPPPASAPVFTGRLDDGACTHCSAVAALAPRASAEALLAAERAAPLFVHGLERLLMLLRPLSFTQ